MSQEGNELLRRLEREAHDDLVQHHADLRERRRRALDERPEARAAWERAQAEADARDAASGGASEQEWQRILVLVARPSVEAGDPLPDRDDLAAVRDWFLERIEPDEIWLYQELLTLSDEALYDLADRLLALRGRPRRRRGRRVTLAQPERRPGGKPGATLLRLRRRGEQ